MYLFVKKNNVYTSFDLYIWKIFKTAAIDMEDLRIQCIIAVIDVEDIYYILNTKVHLG